MPKSQAGVRSVVLPQWLIPELLTHLEQYAEPGPAGRVFVGAKGSTPRRGHWTKIWRAAKAKAGVDDAVHFHDLREFNCAVCHLSLAAPEELTEAAIATERQAVGPEELGDTFDLDEAVRDQHIPDYF